MAHEHFMSVCVECERALEINIIINNLAEKHSKSYKATSLAM